MSEWRNEMPKLLSDNTSSGTSTNIYILEMKVFTSQTSWGGGEEKVTYQILGRVRDTITNCVKLFESKLLNTCIQYASLSKTRFGIWYVR